jgi:hypothetical protein
MLPQVNAIAHPARECVEAKPKHLLIFGHPVNVCRVWNHDFVLLRVLNFNSFGRSFIRSIQELHHIRTTESRKNQGLPERRKLLRVSCCVGGAPKAAARAELDMAGELDELMTSNLKTRSNLGFWSIDQRKQQVGYCGENRY